jgi:hypothetical protein
MPILLSISRDSPLDPITSRAAQFVSLYHDVPEFTAILEEYKALRTELTARLNIEAQIQGFAVLLMGAALPVAAAAVQQRQFILLLLIPAVFSFVGWLFLQQDQMITLITIYLQVRLAPRMETMLGKLKTAGPIWEWELFQPSISLHPVVDTPVVWALGIVRYAFPLVPSLASITAFIILFPSDEFHMGSLEFWTLVGDAGLLLMLIVSALSIRLTRRKHLRGGRPASTASAMHPQEP